MKKKLISLLLAGSVVASMAAVATTGASAVLNADGSYTIDKSLYTQTKKLYFNMPEDWKTTYTDDKGKTVTGEAACYWWAGADACDAIDGSGGNLEWPGYKATYDNSLEAEGLTSLYYVEVCDTEDERVPAVVWNNYIDGGLDDSKDQYAAAIQCINSDCEYLSEGDLDLYDNQEGFWDAMAAAYEGDDKSALGNFADNFFDGGYSLYYDNMIWIVNPNVVQKGETNDKENFGGDWFFYYGDGSYGSWPNPEDAKEQAKNGNGVYVNLLSADLSVGATDGKAGDTVEIPVTIDKNKDIETINFGFDFDATKLELIGFTAGDAFAKLEKVGSTADEIGPNEFIVTGATGTSGTVMTLTFKILTDEAGTYPINFDGVTALNGNGVAAELNLNAGSITVKGEDATETTEPTDAAKPSVPQPDNSDAKSTVDESNKKTTDNGTVQTGTTSLAVVLFVVLAGVATVVFFTRKKYNQ